MQHRYIDLPEHLPGISALMAYRPETARPLSQLAETILRGPSELTSGERETIAAYVSRRNDCVFCCESHSAAARAHLGDNAGLVDEVLTDVSCANIDDKLRSLLMIASRVVDGGLTVRSEDIERARAAGASDQAIHDAVLVAAAFCMYNRYVDALGTWAPAAGDERYVASGERLAREGYV
ncbi:MAG: peroxidase-related enzyme [bacterium]|nr:peroxidase-related enzyme [Candidatus Kapabacteria bacterium]